MKDNFDETDMRIMLGLGLVVGIAIGWLLHSIV